MPVTVVDDTLDEDDETVVVTLSSPTNATLGANTTHTYTIQDNDAPPTVQFSTASSSRLRGDDLGEPGRYAQCRLQQDGDRAVRGYRRDGDESGRLHRQRHQLTFNPGVTSQNVPITVVNDTLDEDDETIVVTLSSPTNATLGANTTHTYTIQDNDAAPTVQFSTASSSGAEATTSVNLAVTLSGRLRQDGDRAVRGHRRHGHGARPTIPSAARA